MLRQRQCFWALLRIWQRLYVHLICIFVCAKSNTLLSDFGGRPYLCVFSSKPANEWLLTLQKFIIWPHWLKDEWTYYALKRHVKALARRDSGLISPLPDKRQHGRETEQRRRRGGGDGEVEEEAEREERYKMGGRGKGWREVERWRLWSCNKKGGTEKGAYSTFRAEGRERRNWEGWQKRGETVLGHLMFPLSWHQPLSIHSSSLHWFFFASICISRYFLLHCPIVCLTFSFFYSPSLLPSTPSSLFGRSLKGGHEGDNANTGPLNREWEEDSCWRWQRWLLKRNLSLFPPACCRTHTHTHRTHTLRLVSFHGGHNVTTTLPTVKHEGESTHLQACVITRTHVNAHTLYNSQWLVHKQWAHGETHPCVTLNMLNVTEME